MSQRRKGCPERTHANMAGVGAGEAYESVPESVACFLNGPVARSKQGSTGNNTPKTTYTIFPNTLLTRPLPVPSFTPCFGVFAESWVIRDEPTGIATQHWFIASSKRRMRHDTAHLSDAWIQLHIHGSPSPPLNTCKHIKNIGWCARHLTSLVVQSHPRPQTWLHYCTLSLDVMQRGRLAITGKQAGHPTNQTAAE